jgi:tetratricopeptide (TPR) repeat protein
MQVEASFRVLDPGWRRLVAALAAFCWTLAPAGELLEVPYPNLDSAEPAVRATLESARASLDAMPAEADLATAYGEMGELYHAHHVYVPADSCYRNALALRPDDFRWHYYQARLMAQTGRPKEALAGYRRAAELRPDYAPAQLRLADAWLEASRPDQAEPLYRNLIDDPGMRDAARFGLGRLLLERGEATAAAALFEQVLADQPEATRVHYSLGMAYRAQGEVEAARRQLALRGEGEPGFPDPELERLDQLAGGVRTLLFQAIASVHSGHHRQAVEGFRQALAEAPDNVNARVSLARSLYLIDEGEASRAELEQALAIDPDHALAHFFLGVWHTAANDPPLAEAQFRSCLALEPSHSGAHHFLANRLLQRGDYAEAARHYALAADADRDNAPARAMAAAAALRAGRPHIEVRTELERGLAQHPDDQTMQYLLARLLAASPEEEVRDGARALAIAELLYERQYLLEHAETLAMAQAEAVRYADAVALQQRVVGAAAGAGRFFQLPRLQAQLGAYQEERPWREPFDPMDPVFRPVPLDPVGVFREYPTTAAY